MDNSERIATWESMADHFLDSDMRGEVPRTALTCLRAGLSVEEARDIWRHDVTPALCFNLYLVAGEWGAWDRDWLLQRIAQKRRRGRGWLARLLYRCEVGGNHAVWLQIEGCMRLLSPMSEPERIAMTDVLSKLAAIDNAPALPPSLVAAVRDAYTEPPRAYHNFAHVLEVLASFQRVTAWKNPEAVYLAILCHDALYEAGRSDNEERSAELAARLLGGTMHERHISRVQQLIRLTARHGSIDPAEVDEEAALFLDCDMAILGAPPDEYDAYEAAIAEEYRLVPPELYRTGRAAFLRKLLARPVIYLSPFFRAEREQAARTNVGRALERLSAAS
jgi:predicted metal-dependent HD superfamily phosphohydrolase